MGPPIYIGGNGVRGGNPILTGSRFNGATDLHRWKLLYLIFKNWQNGNASMGPPIYIGGNCADWRKFRSRISWLQWGHRFTSVETYPYIHGLWNNPRASMGPPIYIGGNQPEEGKGGAV